MEKILNRIIQTAKDVLPPYLATCSITPPLPNVIGLVVCHPESGLVIGEVVYKIQSIAACDLKDMGHSLIWASELLENDNSDSCYRTSDGIILSFSFRNQVSLPSLELFPDYRGLKDRLYAEVLFRAKLMDEEEYLELQKI